MTALEVGEPARHRFVELSVPPLEPVDVLALLVLPFPYNPKGRHLFPNGGPRSQDDFMRAYRVAIHTMLPVIAAELKDVGLLSGEPPYDHHESRLCDLFVRWWHEDLGLAVRPLEQPTPRHREIWHFIAFLRLQRRLPSVLPGNYTKQLIDYARGKGREQELRDAVPDLSSDNQDEWMAGVWLADDPRAMRLKWDQAGTCMMVPCIQRIFDALVRGSRSVHRAKKTIIDTELVAKTSQDGEDATAAVETAELAREVRNFCTQRGRAFVAALEHMQERGTMQALALAHGVSVSAIQRAELAIRRRFAS